MKKLIALGLVAAFVSFDASAKEVKCFDSITEMSDVLKTLPSLGWTRPDSLAKIGAEVYYKNGSKLSLTRDYSLHKFFCIQVQSAEEVKQENYQQAQETSIRKEKAISIAKEMGL